LHAKVDSSTMCCTCDLRHIVVSYSKRSVSLRQRIEIMFYLHALSSTVIVLLINTSYTALCTLQEMAKTLKKYLAAVDYSLDEDVVPFVVKYVSITHATCASLLVRIALRVSVSIC
jgi:hypothetical protein